MSNPYETEFWPEEIKVLKEERALEVIFDNGQVFKLPAEYLRVESPSAEVQGHNPDQKVTVDQRAHVGIMSLETIGNYAVRIIFDDLHDTGIYTWKYLYELGTDQEKRWAQYLSDLAAKGMTRFPPHSS